MPCLETSSNSIYKTCEQSAETANVAYFELLVMHHMYRLRTYEKYRQRMRIMQVCFDTITVNNGELCVTSRRDRMLSRNAFQKPEEGLFHIYRPPAVISAMSVYMQQVCALF